MVSLSDKITIEKSLRESPKAFALFSYLNGTEINIPNSEYSETDRIYYSMLDSLIKNKDNSFKQTYEGLSQRKVLKEQPIIYDNYLLFVLINGVIKFGLNSDWIRFVINLRDTLNEPEKSITTAFINLLNRNYLSTEGIVGIILAALIKQEEKELNTTIIKNSFQSNRNIIQYLEKDLFITSIYLFTNDYIISISISEEGIQLREFEAIFLKRVALIQNVIYVLILSLLVVIWFYLISRYPQVKELANNLGILLQIIGVGLLAFGLNKIKSLFGKLIKIFFGYKRVLSKGNK